jgi:hypothetical protein
MTIRASQAPTVGNDPNTRREQAQHARRHREAFESWLNREAIENWLGAILAFVAIGRALSAPAILSHAYMFQ